MSIVHEHLVRFLIVLYLNLWAHLSMCATTQLLRIRVSLQGPKLRAPGHGGQRRARVGVGQRQFLL